MDVSDIEDIPCEKKKPLRKHWYRDHKDRKREVCVNSKQTLRERRDVGLTMCVYDILSCV